MLKAKLLVLALFLVGVANAQGLPEHTQPKKPSKKAEIILFTADTLLAVGDVSTTIIVLKQPGGYERNPLARPFTNLPRPAYVASSLAMITSLNYISHRMHHSQNKFLRKTWWVLPVAAAIGNAYGMSMGIHALRSQR